MTPRLPSEHWFGMPGAGPNGRDAAEQEQRWPDPIPPGDPDPLTGEVPPAADLAARNAIEGAPTIAELEAMARSAAMQQGNAAGWLSPDDYLQREMVIAELEKLAKKSARKDAFAAGAALAVAMLALVVMTFIGLWIGFGMGERYAAKHPPAIEAAP